MIKQYISVPEKNRAQNLSCRIEYYLFNERIIEAVITYVQLTEYLRDSYFNVNNYLEENTVQYLNKTLDRLVEGRVLIET